MCAMTYRNTLACRQDGVQWAKDNGYSLLDDKIGYIYANKPSSRTERLSARVQGLNPARKAYALALLSSAQA